MNKIVIYILIIFGFIQSNAQDIVSVKGKIKKSTTKLVWVYNLDKSISDTVNLSFFGKFNYQNVFNEGELCFVKPLESEIPLVFNIQSNSAIKFVTIMPNIHKNLQVKGGSKTSKSSEFLNRVNQFKYKITETENKLYTDETADGQYYYDSVLTAIQKEYNAYKMEFVKENKNSSSLLLMDELLDYENDHELIAEVEVGLRHKYSNTEMYKKVNKCLYKHKLYQQKFEGEGGFAPNLMLPGVNEEDISMESLSGNYILLDFWASWCAPCRAEHPRLVKLYNQYHTQGFEVYSVSLDKNKEDWINAIQKDNLSWKYHVSSLKLFDCPSTSVYEVNSLPYNVLIDKEGRVIAVNLRGEKLENKLKQLIDETK